MKDVADDSRSAAEPADLIGRVLAGRFRIDARLGSGGMGAVYRAHHLSLGRDVALKVLHAHLTEDEMVARRFDREARAASKLDHPNCVQVLDTGTTEGGLKFLVMQLLQGRELRGVQEGPMPFDRAVDIGRQIFLGLEHAHRRGLVHRDLKPENVFIVRDDDGRDVIKLVDFGIVKLISGDGSDERLTRAGVVFGTPCYMSPEQAAGGKVDERTDLYSVGILLYEMLTGAPPFQGEEMGIVLRMQLIADPPPLPESVPAPLRAVVMRLLEKDAKDRFASARDAREALEAAARASKDATAVLAVAPPPVAVVAPPPVAVVAPAPVAVVTPSSASASRPASSRIVFMRADALQEPAPAPEKRGFPLVLVALAIGVTTMMGTLALAVRGCASSQPGSDPEPPAAAPPVAAVPVGAAALDPVAPEPVALDLPPLADAEEPPDDDEHEDDERDAKEGKEAHKEQEKREKEARKRLEHLAKDAKKKTKGKGKRHE